MHYDIHIEKSPISRVSQVDFDNIPFGRIFSDHMFEAEYRDGDWCNCSIVPFHSLEIHPAFTALHYGQSIFEGLKAYKSINGIPQIFRPDGNANRFNKSATRMAMPEVPEELFLAALHELISLDSDWIPTHEGSALYIRPLMFATDEFVGIKPADSFNFIIFTSPVGSYYPRPVKVLVAQEHVRAFRGGVGTAKAAGNYAATMLALKNARKEGYDQVLWTDGVEFKYIQEIGTMNVFFVIDDKVITPSLDDGTILDGITRDSVIQLLKDKDVPIEIRRISIDEIYGAHKNGKLNDFFGTGTAATISHISDIGYRGENLHLPDPEIRTISNQLKQELEDIKTSRIPDRHNWLMRVV